MKIIKNSIMCNRCGDTITSKHRHDFVKCSCGTVAADGGMDYLKRSFNVPSDYTDLSMEVEDV